MTLALFAVRAARLGLDMALVALVATVLAGLLVARLVPVITGAPVLVVGGASMEPAIGLGSIAVDQPVTDGSLAVGDVVSLQVGPQLAIFTHRVTRLVPRDDGLWIETKGDANRTVDPSIVPASSVIGRVAVVIPLLGYVVQLLGTLFGLGLLLLLGVIALAGTFALEIVEEELVDAQHQLRPVRVHTLLRAGRGEPAIDGDLGR
jgi:signal peptidase